MGFKHGDLLHVAGTPIAFAAETDRVLANIDHFWITLATGAAEPVLVTLSTHSRQNAAAGFDARMRLGTIASTWAELPTAGVTKSTGLDYAALEAVSPVTYIALDRPDLERLLTEKTNAAVLVEAWGELYVRTHVGVHQVHSMRASSAVPRDFIGRDGAIRFYFEKERRAELLLFKYCGQP
jgi:hypothetical protein